MLSIEELRHYAGSVKSIDEINKNNASYEAGFLGSKFYQHSNFAQESAIENKKIREADQFHHLKTKKSAQTWQLVKEGKLTLITPEYYTKPLREAHAVGVEAIGLSKGAKVRHDKKRQKLDRISKRVRTILRPIGRKVEMDSRMGHDNFESMYAIAERNKAKVLPLEHEKFVFKPSISPVSVHLQARDWSGQYRAQVITQPPSGSAPDANHGERFTEKLTKRSVSKIFESGAYVAQCQDGFTTFMTPTFSREQRLALFGAMSEAEGRPYTPVEFVRDEGELVYGKNGPYTLLPEKPFKVIKTMETTIGREISRFLDACKKMYHRGWTTSAGEHVDGHYKMKPSPFGPDREKADFHYIWVAECPANDDGEPNPHVHLIVKWSVEKKHFQEWVARLEKLWGHGTVKTQWIKQPKAASTYLIKAVGYAAKGDNADQGLIRGNRYNIARCSRAPAWETLATFEADNITAIIKELGYKLEQWKKPLKRSLSRIHMKKAQTIKASAIAKQQNKPQIELDKMQGRIIRLERAAKKVAQDMKQREVHVSSENRFSITFDGDNAKEKLDNFLFWACGARGWPMEIRGATGQYCEKERREIYGIQHDIDLSEVRNEAREFYSVEYQHFLDRRSYWKSVLKDSVPDGPSEDDVNSMIAEKYQALGWQ